MTALKNKKCHKKSRAGTESGTAVGHMIACVLCNYL